MRTNLLSEASKAWIYTPADAGQDIEVIHWQYYYYQTILGVVGGTVSMPTSLSFFNATAGQPTVGGVLTKEDTNIPKPNSVGSPYKFLIQEVKFNAMPAVPVTEGLTVGQRVCDDIAQILTRGVASLRVLGVDRMEVSPLGALPSGMGFDLSDAASAYNVANGWPVLSNSYPVEIGLHKDTSFELNIDFPKGGFVVYNYIKLGFILDGLLQRPKGK